MNRVNDDTAAKILAAATKVFAQKGRAGARVQEIAEAAGVNKALIFYYYRSKAALYREALWSSFGRLVGRLFDEIVSEGTAEEKIGHLIATYIGFMAANPDLPRLAMFEIMDGLDYFRPMVSELALSQPHNLPDLIVGAIREEVESGRFRAVDPDQTIISLMGMIIFPFLARPLVQVMRPDIDLGDIEFLERRKSAVADLLFHGLLEPKGKGIER